MKIELLARLQPLQAGVRARLRVNRSLGEVCVKHTILAPEEKGEMPPVLLDPADRARVIKAQAETTLEHEWRRIKGGVSLHQATHRYVFKNVLATPFGFFAGGNSFSRFGPLRIGKLFTTEVRRVPRGFYASSPICLKYFGHWLTDGLPLTLLAEEDEALYLPFDSRWHHAASYLDLLGITRIPNEYVLFDEMSFCVDIGQNENRRCRLRQVRDRLHRAVKGHGNKLVYLQRGQTGARRHIVNEDDLIVALEASGFVTIPSDAPLQDLLAACRGVETLISIEGSHMTHALLAANEGALHITLNQADRFNNVFVDYMPALRSRLGTIVMEPCGAGYYIDIPHTLEFLRRHSSIS